MRLSRSAVGLVAFLLGCAADVGAGESGLGAADALAPAIAVPAAAWMQAPPGCEGLRGLVASCDGEPALGALLASDGEVLCIDSLSVLSLEMGDPTAGDPSPQPNSPGPTFRY